MEKKSLFEQVVDDLFNGSDKKLVSELNDTIYSYAAKQDLRNRFNDFYNSNRKNSAGKTLSNKAETEKWAKNLGVNLDRGAERNAYHDEMLRKYGSYENALKAMNPELRDAAVALNKINDPKVPKAEKDAINKKYGGIGGLQRYRDILDKMSLTPVYDQGRAAEAGTNYAPFGTNYKVQGDNGVELSWTKAGNVVGYDYENLDLTEVPKADIVKYFKTGTRKDHHFAENPNNPTYAEMADMAKNGDEEALSELRNLYFKAEFNKILNSKFGYDFKIPTSMYTYGNAKLPDDTLVINFTSAHRCPAWNECLVGYACYARGSEHNYEGLHKKNSNLHLMWQSAHDDPELLRSMFKVIKMHLFNPSMMATALLNNKLTAGKWISFLNNQKEPIEKIDKDYIARNAGKDSVLGISPFGKNDPQEVEEEGLSILGQALNEAKKPVGARDMLAAYIYNSNFLEIFDKKDVKVLKAYPSVFRGRFIRLNEEGDFIGQWLLDAFDKLAGEFKLLGVSTTAYTCRNLNFTKIQNIILNASTLHVGTGGEAEGNVSASIARRFFAVSSNLYNSLEDTYVPNGRKLKYQVPEKVKSGEYDGSQPLIPLHKKGGKLSVVYDLKPFTMNGGQNPTQFTDTYAPGGPETKNRLYYKCPCGRFGDVLEKGKPVKLNCYLCRMCYEPKDLNAGEIYVLVEVHGDNIDSFDMDKANTARGINDTMQTYREARKIFGNRLSEEHQMSEQLGMKQISDNGIMSVKEHLNEIATGTQNSMMATESEFKDLMNRIDEVERRNYDECI